MAKYFSGINTNGDKYTISIIDDSLNIIFMDNLDLERLVDLLKRKSVAIISIDAPLALYLKHSNLKDAPDADKLIIKKRAFDSMLGTKNLFTYSDRFSISKEKLMQLVELLTQLNKLGFSFKKPGETDRCIIEAYPDVSFHSFSCALNFNISQDEFIKRKIDTLKNRGLRVKDYLKKNTCGAEVNTLCQAYTAYLYQQGECTCLGNAYEGLLVIPSKVMAVNKKVVPNDIRKGLHINAPVAEQPESKIVHYTNRPEPQTAVFNKTSRFSSKVTAMYCGAQYLYTNVDGIIRINDLRPIKSYRPFTEMFEIKYIRLVQVIIGTTDGLRRVKANLIPNFENSNIFKAAEEEDKKKLDSFWGNQGDKRGYLIKFNKVEIIEVQKAW